MSHTGGLNNRNVLSFSSGGWKSEIKVSVGLVSSKALRRIYPRPLLCFWLFAGNFWCSLAFRNVILISAFMFTWPSPCMHLCVKISPFYKDTSHSRLRPILLQHDLLLTNYICNDSISKYYHILTYWGLGLQHMNLGGMGHNSTHDNDKQDKGKTRTVKR